MWGLWVILKKKLRKVSPPLRIKLWCFSNSHASSQILFLNSKRLHLPWNCYNWPLVFCVFQPNRKMMSLCVRSCTFFIKWCFTKLHEMSSSKRPVSWPSWLMSCINVASCFLMLILEEILSLVVFSRGSSLSDRSDARQECRDQKSVWQHPGYYWCKWNTVWRTAYQHHIYIILFCKPRVYLLSWF